MKKLFFLLASLALLIFPINALARDNVDSWYIKNFESNITVNKDSTLIIDEKITADCGDCYNKHGIFRVLPIVYSPSTGKKVNLHISLISITDFNGKAHPYQVINDRANDTITWKIGDANKTVQGINEYEIKYKVLNGTRTDDPKLDEFYWNLNGNFWDIQTDKFTATISFPDGINQSNSQVNLYSGSFGQKDAGLASYSWVTDTKLQVEALKTLDINEGITVSVAFPKGIVTGYQTTFFEKYGAYFSFLIPLLILYFCYLLWKKFGKDPSINPTVAPEFGIPDKLSPMSLGMVMTDGILKSQFISATMINLAVKKALKIEEIKGQGIFRSKDYKLTKLTDSTKGLTDDEGALLGDLFGGQKEIMLSSLKNNFYKHISPLSSFVKDDLVKRRLLLPHSRLAQYLFIFVAIVLIVFGIASAVISGLLSLNLILSAVIVFIFSFFMTKRTTEGAEFNKKILGFKLYMETAEKYRQKFNEKENIFERFLPYAMMFGTTTLWINKMKQIYGEEYFSHYYPYWFVGSMANFNADSFNDVVSNMSSTMASTITSAPSSSGSGGGGFSGGGGGGGGGGGW